jgi:hypothetical protein
MKKLLSLVLIFTTTVGLAQPGKKGKDPKMAPVLVPGYYVTAKGDTVKGEIQTNLENEGLLYREINFKDARSPKVTVITTKKAKAYGFGDNHFTLFSGDPQNEIYLKYMAKGRLNFMEYKFETNVAGKPTIVSEYYIQDTKADDANKELRELKKLNEKFYKKNLQPYMKDQPMIWSDMDKFVFKPDVIANSIREYNRFYEGN